MKDNIISTLNGNYEKYKENYTNIVDSNKPEFLKDDLTHRVREVKERLGIEESKHKLQFSKEYTEIMDYVYNPEIKDEDLHELKPPKGLEDVDEALFVDALRARYMHMGQLHGRLSPNAKQELYSLYRQGWTVQDLSYKFGIIPERVKAIIYQKQLFWEEIYPKLGEPAIRLALELEMLYGRHFGFVDYGKDAYLLVERERGITRIMINRSLMDKKPCLAELNTIKEYYKNRKPLKPYHVITEKFVGKKTKGYLIKKMLVWRKHGSIRVSETFKNSCKYAQKHNHHLLPDNVAKKLHLGPRKSAQGYRTYFKLK